MSIAVPEDALPIIKESLERELKLLESKTRMIQEEIKALEEKYNISSKKFLNQFDKGKPGDSQDFFEWWGLLKGLKKLKEKKSLTRTMLLSC